MAWRVESQEIRPFWGPNGLSRRDTSMPSSATIFYSESLIFPEICPCQRALQKVKRSFRTNPVLFICQTLSDNSKL